MFFKRKKNIPLQLQTNNKNVFLEPHKVKQNAVSPYYIPFVRRQEKSVI